MSDNHIDEGIAHQIDAVEIPDGWHYDPGWTWGDVDAAIYHESLHAVLEGDHETSYVIEIKSDAVLLREVRWAAENQILECGDQSEISELLEYREELLTPSEG
ncbi:hypothetical protein [Natronococcus wangiae]|uniref:hypothetical protein n=1 Tax=Natronococcus wangiae TaxID=3068275 RepID=UPI00273DF848|nr:hypothetical protein [Natronococcus sp. AD5]